MTRPDDELAGPMSAATILATRLAEERRRCGLSLVSAAQRVAPELEPGAFAQRIKRIESGKRLDLALAHRLAAAYGTTLAALVANAPIERLVLRRLARAKLRERVRIWRTLQHLSNQSHRR